MDQILETDLHRYVFVSHLAEGGMGSLYLGRRVGASGRGGDGRSTEVVLKQLLPEHSGDQKLIDMFLREWKVTSQLDHHNIVRTLDVLTAGDDYYIVFEYVRGGDLRTILRRAKRRQARLSIDSALFVVSEVLAALAYAHGKRDEDGRPLGLIHRDVTPSNILLGADGTVKLTDFGIAKAPTEGSVMFKVKGKLGYMSPEQARGEPVDARADLFAVGVVLYEALVGERLFVGPSNNMATQAAQVFSQPIRPPSKKRPQISAAIDEVVMRALSLDPVGRFGSAQEFRAALAHAAELDRLTLGEHALAADLRRACGDDSAGWRNLDVPVSATLDAGSEGTGVILTDEDDDAWPDERPLTGSRPAMLPNKELKSVVHVLSRDADLPETKLADDPFAPPSPSASRPPARPPERPDARLAFTRTDFAIQTPPSVPVRPAPTATRPPSGDYDDEDSKVRTRIQTADAAIRRAGASSSQPPPATSSQSKPAASQSRPSASQSRPATSSQPPAATSSARRDPARDAAARAQFETPVPRPSLPPPSLSELDEPLPAEPTRVGAGDSGASPTAPPPPRPPATPPKLEAPATRLTRLPTAASDSQNLPTGRSFEAQERTGRPRQLGPSSLAALERNLGGRPLAKGALAVMLILILVALGIGLGVLLSGPSIEGMGDGMSEVRAPSK